MTAKTPDYREDNKMVVSNNYVRAVHPDSMNINAMKLFRLIVTQCRMHDTEFFEYECKLTDLAEVFHTDRFDLYRDVQKLCKNVMQTVLYIGDGNPKHSWEYRAIFSKCSYTAKTGKLYVKLSPEVTDLFLQLRRNFTRIPIYAILTMKSKYAIRLYELINEKLMSNLPYANHATEITVTLEEARAVTGTDKQKTYNKISNFKHRVFEPALKEIEECANWKIITKPYKNGRQIVGFILQIWSRNGWEYIEDCKAKGIIPDQIAGQMTIFDFVQQ